MIGKKIYLLVALVYNKLTVLVDYLIFIQLSGQQLDGNTVVKCSLYIHEVAGSNTGKLSRSHFVWTRVA